MGIIVLIETQAKYTPTMASEYVSGGIKAVHASQSDPSVPGDPAAETLCGKDTAALEKQSYQPRRPGASWYPQNLRRWLCQTCDRAVRSA